MKLKLKQPTILTLLTVMLTLNESITFEPQEWWAQEKDPYWLKQVQSCMTDGFETPTDMPHSRSRESSLLWEVIWGKRRKNAVLIEEEEAIDSSLRKKTRVFATAQSFWLERHSSL